MPNKIERPAILDQQPDPMWDANMRDTFEVKKRAAQVDFDRALLAPGAPVAQDQLKFLAQAIGRAQRSIETRGDY